MTTSAPALIESTLQPNLTLVLVTVCLVAARTALERDRTHLIGHLGLGQVGHRVAEG